jgi:small subunit ribosomal protein S17e
MGRIKTKSIKRASKELVKNHFDKFTEKFEDNKIAVDLYADILSKKLRNTVAGYVTRLVQQKEKL